MKIDDRLTELRTRRPLGRLATASIAVAVAAVAISAGALAYGTVQVSADDNRRAEVAARTGAATQLAPVTDTQPTTSPTTPTADPAPSEAPPAYPVYDAETDVSTIDLTAVPEGPERENARIWLAQEGIIADCMAEQGYAYSFTPYWQRGGAAPQVFVQSQYAPESGGAYALSGSPDNVGDAYRWQDAGCIGRAVHETGMDDAH